MRKQLIFLFFTYTFGYFGQEYSFDLFTNYEYTDYKITSSKSKEVIKSVGNQITMTKSNDDNIHLTVRRGKKTKTICDYY